MESNLIRQSRCASTYNVQGHGLFTVNTAFCIFNFSLLLLFLPFAVYSFTLKSSTTGRYRAPKSREILILIFRTKTPNNAVTIPAKSHSLYWLTTNGDFFVSSTRTMRMIVISDVTGSSGIFFENRVFTSP